METILCICMGVGLAAACGFRIFVPLLILSIAAGAGHVTLAPSFQWVGSTPALVAFSVATALEIGAYYIPWLDNFLDSVSTPAAVVAGTVVTASMMTNVSPLMQWGLAVIAGGGVAGVVQGATVLTRTVSTTASGGLANPLVSTAELGFSGFFSFLALVLPVAAVVLLIAFLIFMVVKIRKRFFPRPTSAVC